jgi:hypothetical protein
MYVRTIPLAHRAARVDALGRARNHPAGVSTTAVG